MSWLKKLKSGLGKTSARVTASLGAVLGRKGIDAASLEEVEDALISA
ncbi:MAG TPA: signal recognition particle-docking protein FtsY, partial [Alphaproteobacteria bacterium]|nr:signal recognition particle-docking protein FtsY [Alphaproteobacteria bacterium]HBP60034.1 signal recognition particle-docking protein FtsY [Alphaproteobacteria bacterium]HCA90884.1 signal recognition particle-docking protein FtsY [Alphaproteobacteria bacterium]HCD21164.1 signal recognition particle-docking protein FtsY [Alphaproteobacteria bacterium]